MALVFGRERVGLTNEELGRNATIMSRLLRTRIQFAEPRAMAVQVIAYEVRMAAGNSGKWRTSRVDEETPYPLVDDLERFYGHLEQTLLATGFIRENHPGQVMNKLRRLFTRARPESQELNILRGMLASIESRIKVSNRISGRTARALSGLRIGAEHSGMIRCSGASDNR